MIWIRADANREIGSGHVMRCLSIAGALERQGQRTCFLTADAGAEPLLSARGQSYRILDSDYRCPEGELGELEELLAECGGSFFLADSYFVTAEYLRRVREWLPVGYMDDGCCGELPLDVLINYNIFAEASQYGWHRGAQLLLGPRYAPLREEFSGGGYRVREAASRVLITTGGSDRYGLAGRLLRRVLSDPATAGLEYWVVSGAFNAHLAELEEMAGRHPNVRVCSNVACMRELMEQSDIAVTAGGSTMYELSAVGVPTICFSFVDNQERIVEGFSERGLVCFGGNYLAQGEGMLEEAAGKIALLAGDAGLREEYSRRLRGVADGRGAGRIARALSVWEDGG